MQNKPHVCTYVQGRGDLVLDGVVKARVERDGVIAALGHAAREGDAAGQGQVAVGADEVVGVRQRHDGGLDRVVVALGDALRVLRWWGILVGR